MTVYGSQELEDREAAVIAFNAGEIQELASKPVLLGSGCNLQRHCAWAVFMASTLICCPWQLRRLNFP